ncbi:hypothetical protein HHL22_22735 [Hymenobacter sp. RP-2-7]|uniref:Uncharacterized protein n=1 Tax=Hymenobacter polaris TaxID=2682546 RepID=A0A7Y0FQ39_9BACT|nr:hypothetical protein [Hymenobacter polaris]NML68024.1 hypothetical protein [Hymenobacter polaris]
MKAYLLLFGLVATAAHAQTVPFNATAPMRGGAYNQTAVPPANAALDQSTIQGPSEVQRTVSSYDAQPSRLPVSVGVPTSGTPDVSPTAVPDVREQPLIPQRRSRQSTEVVPSRGVGSSTVVQRRPAQPINDASLPQPQP